ncbi:hypothetical protein M422DRAFT_780608 [Sphaerobolus stellatus SS14]|uniref:Uncharacterized protein n=1 Tax=Sphaerobolus stellatus (strain SS14) TaxID=990650 RepID=A0A0C9V1R0_SPHS4|nr:hypothetical protein M422DRAFT_780608 [Sphaerobolus stellatus SS14]
MDDPDYVAFWEKLTPEGQKWYKDCAPLLHSLCHFDRHWSMELRATRYVPSPWTKSGFERYALVYEKPSV